MSNIKIRADVKGGSTNVRALLTHPMESGLRKDGETGELVPAHFIQEVVCKWKGEIVLTAHWNGGVSQNPYLSYRFKGGAAGDPIEITWTDNLGQSESETASIR